MGQIKCCKGCNEREIGCHGSRERYISEKTTIQEAKMALQKSQETDYGLRQAKRKKK